MIVRVVVGLGLGSGTARLANRRPTPPAKPCPLLSCLDGFVSIKRASSFVEFTSLPFRSRRSRAPSVISVDSAYPGKVGKLRRAFDWKIATGRADAHPAPG